jgi:enamine deaminase RidA (YjgF/YER057c/UK114 family)
VPVELLNPEGLPEPEMYRQVAIATGTRTVYVSGQVARTADGTPVGAGDLAAQVDQALGNVVVAVEGAGGSFADVAKLTVHIVDLTPEKMDLFVDGVVRTVGRLGIDPTKAVTLLGVAALAEPDLMVEIEAVAVLP